MKQVGVSSSDCWLGFDCCPRITLQGHGSCVVFVDSGHDPDWLID